MPSHSQSGTFAAVLRDALDAISLTFCKLAKIQYAAPWQDGRRDAC